MEHRALDEYLSRVDALLQECAAPPPPSAPPAVAPVASAPGVLHRPHLYPYGVFDPRADHHRR
ncbi:MAG: hypothetical protein ACT4PX_09260 [Actinomycetota bacterium]